MDLRVVAVVHLFVAGDDEGGFQRGDGVEVGDPLGPFGFTGLGGHHVHPVVGQIAGDDGGQRRDMQDGGVRGVGLADPDDPQLVALQVERAGRQELRQHLVSGAGDLAGEERFPVPGQGGVSRLGENLGCGQTCSSGEALDQPIVIVK